MSKVSSSDDNAAFGRRLTAVRATTGLSQSAFADALGLSLRAYANYERGEREAPVALFRALFERFGIDPIWLLSGADDTPQKAAARAMDFALVERITRQIDSRLSGLRKKMKPEQRARLLRAIYTLSLARGAVDDSELDQVISAAVS
ncbi:MAG: helix-turn-helix transcriptional regulator [Chiayiivirga sp.]|jgi:transcriptional regulator with XRE-family HTH domain|nr:helix-turn-helix transcriptional regulator [Chiayiivirga sp.]